MVNACYPSIQEVKAEKTTVKIIVSKKKRREREERAGDGVSNSYLIA